MRLEHVNLTVADLDRSVDFYCRLLELGAAIHLEADYEPGPRLYFTDPDG
jgi:catechol 2,3-dioxygenase-like lactoylglutathione lyase family enzyme